MNLINTGIRTVEKLVKRIISFTTSDVFCSAMIAILNPPSLREQTSKVTFQGRPQYPQTGWWGERLFNGSTLGEANSLMQLPIS